MNFAMIGLDYKAAPIAVREKISLTKSAISTALVQLHETYDMGVVILSTCNRTEFYFASEETLPDDTLTTLFETTVGANAPLPHYTKRGQELISYLFELGCGLHSMILGEDQIITQLKDALDLSMEHHAGNAPLNTLFRHSITCAKRAKTQVNIQFISPSIVSQAIELAEQALGKEELARKTVLVIGNGEMGRLAAMLFAGAGCKVYMTLRRYKHSVINVPDNCIAVEYDERQTVLSQVDVLVSATKSPHYTMRKADFEQAQRMPTHCFDLALPRDIEPSVKELAGVTCYDVDDIGRGASHYEERAMAELREIIARQELKFDQWLQGYQTMRNRNMNRQEERI